MWLNDLTKHSMRPEAELQSPSGSQVMNFSSLAVFLGFLRVLDPIKSMKMTPFGPLLCLKNSPKLPQLTTAIGQQHRPTVVRFHTFLEFYVPM